MNSYDDVVAAMNRGELAYRASEARPEGMQYPGVGFGTCVVGTGIHKFVSENYPASWVTLEHVEARRQSVIEETIKSYDNVIAAMKRGEHAFRVIERRPPDMQYPRVALGTRKVDAPTLQFVSNYHLETWVTLEQVEASRQDLLRRRPTNVSAS